MGKPAISMAIFHSCLYVYQRVSNFMPRTSSAKLRLEMLFLLLKALEPLEARQGGDHLQSRRLPMGHPGTKNGDVYGKTWENIWKTIYKRWDFPATFWLIQEIVSLLWMLWMLWYRWPIEIDDLPIENGASFHLKLSDDITWASNATFPPEKSGIWHQPSHADMGTPGHTYRRVGYVKFMMEVCSWDTLWYHLTLWHLKWLWIFL